MMLSLGLLNDDQIARLLEVMDRGDMSDTAKLDHLGVVLAHAELTHELAHRAKRAPASETTTRGVRKGRARKPR